ncbi:YceI family protein [Trebonia kvetii]|nr:YceI family protein [Trebonia kvetii]
MNETHSPLASGVTATPPAGRYRIDTKRSTITISTRHLFGIGPVRATLALRDGRIQVNDPPAGSAVRASAAAVSFRSGNDARDAAVLSPRLLDAATYPSLTFISTALERESASDAFPEGRWLLRGELEVRGVGRLVEAAIATVSAHGGTLHATARLRVDRYDFGITAYRGLAARWLTVDLDIIAEIDPHTATEEA